MKKEHLLLILALLIGFLGGMLVTDQNDSISEETMEHMESHTAHIHPQKDVNPDLPIPSVTLDVVQGEDASWNARVDLEHFTFSAESAGSAWEDNVGHAHIYLNGKKINRVYGQWYHLGELEPGKHIVEVILSSNDHHELTHNGTPISGSQIIHVDDVHHRMTK